MIFLITVTISAPCNYKNIFIEGYLDDMKNQVRKVTFDWLELKKKYVLSRLGWRLHDLCFDVCMTGL